MLWPELDQLLKDEDDLTSVTAPYTAAISKYWVVFYDLVDAPLEYESWGNANGHVVHYAQHPCWFNVAIQKELHTPKTLPKVFVIMI